MIPVVAPPAVVACHMASRAVAGRPLRVRGREQRQGCGRHHGTGGTLDQSGDDQHEGPLRQTAGHGGQGKQYQPGYQQAASPQQVSQAAASQEQRTKGKRITGDYPLELGGRHVQLSLDRRQGHVHDAEVQLEHELGRADQDHSQPGPRAGTARGRGFTLQLPRPLILSNSRFIASAMHARSTGGVSQGRSFGKSSGYPKEELLVHRAPVVPDRDCSLVKSKRLAGGRNGAALAVRHRLGEGTLHHSGDGGEVVLGHSQRVDLDPQVEAQTNNAAMSSMCLSMPSVKCPSGQCTRMF